MIEVAGTLERDRTTKLRHYARSGIPQYVILRLGDRTAEEYLAPDPATGTYTQRKTHLPGSTLHLQAGDEHLEVSVDQLFTPR